jgi:hypothetical protein
MAHEIVEAIKIFILKMNIFYQGRSVVDMVVTSSLRIIVLDEVDAIQVGLLVNILQ